MLPSAEVAVMLLVVGLYLQDALLLLYDNEGVLEAEGAGRYRIHLGARTLHLAGRNPFLPNPFAPWRPLYRLAWDASLPLADQAATPRATLERSNASLRSLSWGLIPLVLGLFVGLPLCLYFDIGWRLFLMLVAAMYAAAFSMLWMLWRRRRELALDAKRFALICLESLVCLPCALNLVRKVSTQLPIGADLVDTARAYASASDVQRLLGEILRRLDEDIEAADLGGPRWQTLTNYRARLAELLS
jgi:hypothetical protein